MKKTYRHSYRHGEILFVKITKLPTGLKQAQTDTLMVGSNNNPHTFKGGKFYKEEVGDYIFGYFQVKDTKLYHPEHGKGKGKLKVAKLPDGNYELRRQVEFTPEGLRPVID